MNVSPVEFTVFVDDNFHYQDEDERYRLGVYPTYEAALEACRTLVDQDLANFFKPGMTAAALIAQYTRFGEDPWITPTPEGTDRFSAWNYARERAATLCG